MMSSSDALNQAVRRLSQALGHENVRTGEELEGYQDPYAFAEGETAGASAAVLPASAEEVKAVLAVARQHHVPLWTVSRGRNFAYGGAEPRVPSSIIVDLSRMNAVLEVDEETGTALIEPGVSFADLYAHLRSIGSSLWISVPELSWGSVIGNALERGFGYAAGTDHSAQICGMEVVLADGQVLRTGMGAMTANRAWPLVQGRLRPVT
jgi:4-cresol dehydrogenase (hydroxylating) flavoprotein subunit